MENRQLEHHNHVPKQKKYPLCLLAHNITSPLNIGSLFRIADAFGLEKIYLTGSSPVPPHQKIRRTSRSSEKFVSFTHEESPLPLIQNLKRAGYTIVSLEITSESQDIKDFYPSDSDKICLILGAENEGVCQDLLDMSDKTVHIPMLGYCSSLNVAIACSIALFEITRKWASSDATNCSVAE